MSWGNSGSWALFALMAVGVVSWLTRLWLRNTVEQSVRASFERKSRECGANFARTKRN